MTRVVSFCIPPDCRGRVGESILAILQVEIQKFIGLLKVIDETVDITLSHGRSQSSKES